MKRLHYIYASAPLALALNNVPLLLSGACQLAAAAALALGLWAVVWMRLYTNRKLRPEFSLLTVLPQSVFYGLRALQEQSPEAAAPFAAPFWSNLYFFLWCAAAFVALRALFASPSEEKLPAKRDPLFLFMAILTVAFCFASWAGSVTSLFPLSTT
ncbi:MAG: hypothetical protein MJ051_00585 [Akkermansia sp.]|nr:hypothetical protein [Akkermansia sp.]